jgi:Complex 1 protein (LYR family)
MSSPSIASTTLLSLYRRLLRSAASFPSKNRTGIYQAIQQEFRENVGLDPSGEETKKKVEMALKGLTQLRQFDVTQMAGGKLNDPTWKVSMEQNPMPSPPDFQRKQ